MNAPQLTLKPSDRPLRVFLCHSSGDKPFIRDLYQCLRSDGFAPWLDEEELLPGQEWQEEIPKAVRTCHVVLVCLSRNSITKEGYVQKEIQLALDAAQEKPPGTIFLIPVRVEEVDVPTRLSRWQWVNLFEPEGYPKLIRALNTRSESRVEPDRAAAKSAVLGAIQEANKAVRSKDFSEAWQILQATYQLYGRSPILQKAVDRFESHRHNRRPSFWSWKRFLEVGALLILVVILAVVTVKERQLRDVLSDLSQPTFKHGDRVTWATFSPNGQRIVTASYDHTARLWNADSSELIAQLQHKDTVWQAAFSPDSQRIVTASSDATARVWNASSGQQLAILQHNDVVVHAVFSPDGQRIATASEDHTACIWDSSNGRLLLTLQGHKGAIWYVAFSPDGKSIVTASQDKTSRVWNAVNGQMLFTLQHDGVVTQATFSPDGKSIVTASFDKTARVWNAAGGQLLTTLHHDDQVRGAAFSSDDQHIVTASWDRTARVWNTNTGQLLAILGHDDRVTWAIFSPDGQRIVTASNDETARVWNARNGRLLAQLQHDGLVRQAAFSSDGQRIITASYDCTAQIWSVGSRQLLAGERDTDVVTFLRKGIRQSEWTNASRRLRKDTSGGRACNY